MKLIFPLFLILVACAPKGFNSKKATQLDLSVWNNKKYEFAVLIHDLNTGKYSYWNDSLIAIRFTPASTFKIANTIIGLETNAVQDVTTTFEWDSTVYKNPKWNHSQDMRSAFINSTVWYYQALARKIGAEKMENYLTAFTYGNSSCKGAIDSFWLNGELKISMMEQIQFIDKIVNKKLEIRPEIYEKLEKLMLLKKVGNYSVYGKTGWGVEESTSVGWLVGYAIDGDSKVSFATLILSEHPEDFDFAAYRKNITFTALKRAGYIKDNE